LGRHQRRHSNFRSHALQQIEQCIPYAVNVQVKTEMRDDEGKAHPSDWDRVCQMLVAGKYKGYLALEYEAKEAPQTGMPRLLTKLRTLVHKYSA
jgi:hydroxypyruvate isomerase